MLSRIDQYVVNRFVRTLGVALASFIAIYVVVDLIDHLDDFFVRDLGPSAMARYYLHYMPYIVVFTLPIGMLLATLFVIGDMGVSNELVAIKAAGISIYRVAWPLLRLAFLISLVALFLAELVVPRSNEIRRGILDTRSTVPTGSRSRHLTRQDPAGYVLYAAAYHHGARRATNVTIVRLIGGETQRRIDATQMVWDDEGWLLLNATDRIFADGAEELASHVSMRLPSLSLRPADLARVNREPEQMTFLELRDFIGRARHAGGDASRWLVDLHIKVAFPLASFMMVWLGFPLAARAWRGGKAMYIGWTLLIGFAFFVTVRAGQAMARAGSISPVVGAWSADLLFLLVGVALFRWTRK